MIPQIGKVMQHIFCEIDSSQTRYSATGTAES
jgi:hypothetical protein